MSGDTTSKKTRGPAVVAHAHTKCCRLSPHFVHTTFHGCWFASRESDCRFILTAVFHVFSNMSTTKSRFGRQRFADELQRIAHVLLARSLLPQCETGQCLSSPNAAPRREDCSFEQLISDGPHSTLRSVLETWEWPCCTFSADTTTRLHSLGLARALDERFVLQYVIACYLCC